MRYRTMREDCQCVVGDGDVESFDRQKFPGSLVDRFLGNELPCRFSVVGGICDYHQVGIVLCRGRCATRFGCTITQKYKYVKKTATDWLFF